MAETYQAIERDRDELRRRLAQYEAALRTILRLADDEASNPNDSCGRIADRARAALAKVDA